MADWWGNGQPVTPLGGNFWNPSGSAAPRAAGAAGPTPAKFLDFKAAGAGLENAGITDRNMYPRFEKLRGLKDQKEGGNAQLWKNLDRWENTPQGANVDPEQKRLFDLYHRTGKRDPGLKDDTVAAALDWGVREGTRSQVHKERFMDSTLGRLLGIPITAAGYAVGGPLGAGIANGLYQGIGNKDVLSGLGGFASGYAGGSFGGKVLGVTGNAAGLPGGGTFSGLLGKNPLTSVGLGGKTAGRVATKGGSAVAKALRARQQREEAERRFRGMMEP
jgi:hypothetical protein